MILNKTRTCCSLALLALNARRCIVSGFVVPRSSSVAATFQDRATAFNSEFRTYSSTTTLNMSEKETEVNVGGNIAEVRQKMVEACEGCGRNVDDVRLVAVSKTKPLDLVKQAYESGQRVFGENYAQELVEKAGEMSGESDIVWHFIGGLQSNKANMLVKGVVPHGKLVVETVNSFKVANKLNNAMSNFDGKLSIFVQVNTSGEEAKSGVAPDDAVELCKQITSDCENIHLQGVMTIGAVGDMDCFDRLVECRAKCAEALGMSTDDLEMSMGMSGDYEVAIQKGATNVRVGSTIFGARDYSNK